MTAYFSDMQTMKKSFKLSALSLITFSVIVYELLLTRIFSLVFSYHYVFVILSVALLGSGTGALLLRWFRKKFDFASSRWKLAVAVSWSIIISGIGVSTVDMLWSGGNGIYAAILIFVFAVLPFFTAGMLVSSFYQDNSRASSLLYAVDLLGAAAGAVLAIPLLNYIPAGWLFYLLALFPAGAAILLSVKRDKQMQTPVVNLIVIGVAIVITGLLGYTKLQPLQGIADKDMNNILSDSGSKASITDSRWSAFGRTDIVTDSKVPFAKYMFIDGAAGTRMFHYKAVQTDSSVQKFLTYGLGEGFPLQFMSRAEKDSALVIGAGGGRDVLAALLSGVRHITAVEVNPQISYFMKKYDSYNGGLYTSNPKVHYVQSEGRRFTTESLGHYDLIFLGMPVTKSSRSLDGLLLTENYLFTVQAFQTYLKKLTPEGRLVLVTHGSLEMYRAVFTAVEAMKQKGIPEQEAMKHIYVVNRSMLPVVVIKKEPFTPEEAQVMHVQLHKENLDRGSYYMPFEAQQLIPASLNSGLGGRPMFDPVLMGLSMGHQSLGELIRTAPVKVNPVTDNSPFYYNFDRGIPPVLKWLLIFVIIVITGATLWFYRRHRLSRRKLKPRVSIIRLSLIALLSGLGFMTAEIVLTQQLSLLLGQPTYSLAIVLLALLTGAAAGGLISHSLKWSLKRMGTTASVIMTVLLAGWVFLDSVLVYGGYVYTGWAVFYVFLMGTVMGIPLPAALRMAGPEGIFDESLIHYLWGLNGLASVVGSVIAMVIGITLGFTAVLVVSLACYLLIVYLFSGFISPSPVSPGIRKDRKHKTEKFFKTRLSYV